MAKETVNHLRAWREYRKLTGEQLATLVGTTKGVISQLETEKRGLSDKWLRRLAPALHTQPGILLDHDPETLPAVLLEALADIPPNRRAQAVEIFKTFRKVI